MKMKVKNSSGTARTAAVMVRLSEAELEAARAKAAVVGLTVSDLIRQLLAGLKPRPRRRIAIMGLPEVRKATAFLGHVLRNSLPSERLKLVNCYQEAVRHFVALQVQAERLQEQEDSACH